MGKLKHSFGVVAYEIGDRVALALRIESDPVLEFEMPERFCVEVMRRANAQQERTGKTPEPKDIAVIARNTLKKWLKSRKIVFLDDVEFFALLDTEAGTFEVIDQPFKEENHGGNVPKIGVK